MSKFKKGDILIKLDKSKKKINGKFVEKPGTKVRVICLKFSSGNLKLYSVYNIDFDKYEVANEEFLKLDIEYLRDKKIEKIIC
jgi:hypothetical protein